MRRRRRGVALVAAVASLLLAVALTVPGFMRAGVHSPISDPDDFRAFYCAGQALLGGHDPYATEPLRGCEHAAARTFGLVMPPGTVTPAPLPPYAIAFFALFALLPFPLASLMWFACSLAAVAATALILFRLTRLPIVGIAGALVLSDAFVSVNEGQVVPLVAFALCVAAAAVRAGRMGLAASALGVASIEPHLALPALLSLAVLVPRARLAALSAVAVLAFIELSAGGATRSLEYFSTVLPLHARSEVDQLRVQFSLTTLLWALGVPTLWAVRLGAASYVAMLVLGIVLARRVAAASNDASALVLVPPAVTLLGGPFIHLFQMALAVPAALLVIARFRRQAALLTIALVGLAVPVQALLEVTPLRTAFVAHLTVLPATVGHSEPPSSQSGLAQAAQAEHTGAGSFEPPGLSGLAPFAPKLPTWLALMALIVAAWLGCRPARSAGTA